MTVMRYVPLDERIKSIKDRVPTETEWEARAILERAWPELFEKREEAGKR